MEGLKDLGGFLMGLSPPAWVTEVKAERTKQLEMFKRQWIREHKEDTRHDHIIFRGEDPIVFSAESLNNTALSQPLGPGGHGLQPSQSSADLPVDDSHGN